MIKIAKRFLIKPGSTIDLKRRPTRVDPVYISKQDYKRLLKEHVDYLSTQQELLYASNRHAILVIFQGMDAAGKDGCIKHVMSGVNPQGCNVFSYSHPSAVELRHDFLWRTTRDLPERGKIAIFNRSYYEEVVIVRVHPHILAAEAPPDATMNDGIWQDRYKSINDLECHLHRNGTRIVKIFLHMSKEEQRHRLLDRIVTADKNWKINPSDLAEREFWPSYLEAYQECISATTTHEAPWYVVPADDKHSARLFVSHIILEAMEELKLAFPEPSPERRAELLSMRQRLECD